MTVESVTAATREELEDKLDEALEALWRIKTWADAYPLGIFPEPDLNQVKALMGPILLSQVSASNMRHVLDGVRDIVNPFFPAEGGESD